MTAAEIVAELTANGSESIKKIYMRHGAREPFLGVKIEYLKKIQKREKVNHPLALELYDTGISDAMYLAGLIADDMAMSKRDLDRWMKQAYWHMLADYTVPWVASGGRFGLEMGLKWIESKQELTASGGWATLSSVLSTKPNEELDLDLIKKLQERVAKSIHAAPNRVRYTMNGFIIAAGGFVPELTKFSQRIAKKIGPVEVDMGETDCQVPDAFAYIQKIVDRGTVGKKRKSAKC